MFKTIKIHQNLVISRFLENGFEATLRSKTNVLKLKMTFFNFLQIWVTKLKVLSGKVRQSVEDCRNPNLVIGRFLENGFEATLRWNSNVLNLWTYHFPVFCKFLSDEVETFFCQSRTMLRKLFAWSLICWELLRKHFSAFIWSF